MHVIGDLDQSWQHLELRHLAALEAVAAAGSFRAAARALGFSQSAVSEQVASLERIVGCRLLDRARGGRQVTPTAAGRLVLDHLEGISGPVRRLRAELATQAIGHATVRLGIYQSIARYLLPAIARTIEARGLAVRLDLVEAVDDGELLRQVADDELDLAFASLPLTPGPFGSRELFEERYHLVVAEASPLARGADAAPVPLATLSTLPLIDYHGLRAVHHTWSKLDGAQRPASVVFRSDDNGTIHALVAAGLGVAVLPQLSIDERAEGIRVLALEPELPPRRHVIVWHRDRPRSQAVLDVVDLIARLARQPQPLG